MRSKSSRDEGTVCLLVGASYASGVAETAKGKAVVVSVVHVWDWSNIPRCNVFTKSIESISRVV